MISPTDQHLALVRNDICLPNIADRNNRPSTLQVAGRR
jgi:hypothetical protein